MLSGGFFVKQERGFFISHQNIKLFIYIFCIFLFCIYGFWCAFALIGRER